VTEYSLVSRDGAGGKASTKGAHTNSGRRKANNSLREENIAQSNNEDEEVWGQEVKGGGLDQKGECRRAWKNYAPEGGDTGN